MVDIFIHSPIADDDVIQEMRKRSCKNPDIDSEFDSPSRRKKRYTVMGDGWKWGDEGTTMPVTVGFKNYWHGDISPSVQEEIAMDCASVSIYIKAISVSDYKTLCKIFPAIKTYYDRRHIVSSSIR